MVLFDSNYVLHILLEQVPGADPQTKSLIDRLTRRLQERSERILIPTPVLGEVLVYDSAAAAKHLEILHKAVRFKIADFDEIAAIRAAESLAADFASGIGKRAGNIGDWQKIKVDRQIIAVAQVAGVKVVYSNDPDLKNLGERAKMTIITLEQLPTHLSPAPLYDATTPSFDVLIGKPADEAAGAVSGDS